jgi:nitrite reductase/ring-hydroxylating ferredoxin subunit
MEESNCKDCKRKTRWREDFPINWEKDEYITRREMVKFLGLGSLLIAGANFLVAGIPHMAKAEQFPQMRLGLASELAAGGSRLFNYPTKDDPCIAVRKHDGTLVAYSQVCTHLSCAVIHSEKDNALFCPCHNGFFTIDEGRPFAGPPTRPLPRIKLEQRGEEVFAVGVEV